MSVMIFLGLLILFFIILATGTLGECISGSHHCKSTLEDKVFTLKGIVYSVDFRSRYTLFPGDQ